MNKAREQDKLRVREKKKKIRRKKDESRKKEGRTDRGTGGGKCIHWSQ